jgi:hypothetical protein
MLHLPATLYFIAQPIPFFKPNFESGHKIASDRHLFLPRPNGFRVPKLAGKLRCNARVGIGIGARTPTRKGIVIADEAPAQLRPVTCQRYCTIKTRDMQERNIPQKVVLGIKIAL